VTDASVSVVVDRDITDEVVRWVNTEAALLDGWREREWLERMVSSDIVYQVPLRQNVERARGTGFADVAYHFDERYGSLEARVERNETEYAWAEDPPSRIRHFVTNIDVQIRNDDTFSVRSNLLLYRTYRAEPRPELFSAERQDVLRREAGALRLLHRKVLLDAASLEAHNLSLFF
jgi:ethylbenzene dioxygenase beta subunit